MNKDIVDDSVLLEKFEDDELVEELKRRGYDFTDEMTDSQLLREVESRCLEDMIGLSSFSDEDLVSELNDRSYSFIDDASEDEIIEAYTKIKGEPPTKEGLLRELLSQMTNRFLDKEDAKKEICDYIDFVMIDGKVIRP